MTTDIIYISSNNFNDRLEAAIGRRFECENWPVESSLVAMYMARYRPSATGTPGFNMTSSEIAEQMSEICTVSTNDVARVMYYLGFPLLFNVYGSPEWGMVPAPEDGEEAEEAEEADNDA